MKKRSPREVLILALTKLWGWAKGKWANKRLLAQVLAATMAAVTTVAGVSGYQALSARIHKVEARPVADLTPLRSASVDLGKKVDGLRAQALALATQIRTLSNHPPMATLPPNPIVVPTQSASDLAAKLAATAGELSSLSGKVSQAAVDSGSTSAAQAKALSDLSAALSKTASDLSVHIEALDASSASALAQITQQADALASLTTDLGGLSARLVDVATTVDAQTDSIKAAQSTADNAKAATDSLAQALAAEVDRAKAGEAAAVAAAATAQARADLDRALAPVGVTPNLQGTATYTPSGPFTSGFSLFISKTPAGVSLTSQYLLTFTATLSAACTISLVLSPGTGSEFTLTGPGPVSASFFRQSLASGNHQAVVTITTSPTIPSCGYSKISLVAQRLQQGETS